MNPWGPQYAVAVQPKTNGLAVAALVLGILPVAGVGCLLAAIFGSIAQRQIRESNGSQTGEGMAKAGMILGLCWVGLFSVIILQAELST